MGPQVWGRCTSIADQISDTVDRTMLVVSALQDLQNGSGRDPGLRDWHSVGLDGIDLLAQVTGDEQWLDPHRRRSRSIGPRPRVFGVPS